MFNQFRGGQTESVFEKQNSQNKVNICKKAVSGVKFIRLSHAETAEIFFELFGKIITKIGIILITVYLLIQIE